MAKTASSNMAGAFTASSTTSEDKRAEEFIHKLRQGVRCKTDVRGFAEPGNASPTRIVVDASEGFIPLWAPNTTLRWRFQKQSFLKFKDPAAAKQRVRELMGEALLAWGEAVPVKFAEREDAWDFEVVVQAKDDCDQYGCVLASAFFPDSGRHELAIYPKMLLEPEKEQVETLVHELGHIFGLRHFFAQLSEKKWPSEIFGAHNKFTIMNYGAESRLTKRDKTDLRKLYEGVWAGAIKEINGTRIKLVKPFHTL
jgi:Matrixin